MNFSPSFEPGCNKEQVGCNETKKPVIIGKIRTVIRVKMKSNPWFQRHYCIFFEQGLICFLAERIIRAAE
jgi:hypothetical protein